MKRLGRRLTYANVVATLALFLALTGGAVLAASKISGTLIKKNSEPGNRLKKNSVPNSRIKKATLKRNRFAANQIPGQIVLDASASNAGGLTTAPGVGSDGAQIPLSGTTSFTPEAGKVYDAYGEIKGSPIDADGSGGGSQTCVIRVRFLDHGELFRTLTLEQDLSDANPSTRTFTFDTFSGGIGLTDAGQAQTFTAFVAGDPDCGAASTLTSLRVVVVQTSA